MAQARKVSEFYREGNGWFCNGGLRSDITVIIEGVSFHLHKFPLIARCGRIARIYEESHSTHAKSFSTVLDEFPGGPETFLVTVKFCYGVRIELTPQNIATIYCAAYYLKMTDEYGEDNLLLRTETFFHRNILRNWKACILALQNCESIIPSAEKLQIIGKCLNAISMMVCTDPSLFGWPMRMYGSLQSPGGSILWNGINTGARIRSSKSDWWFEDISYLSISLFERLIQSMKKRGIRPENLAGAVMYYARKYLPGLGRWHRTVSSFSFTPATTVDQNHQIVLLESITKLLPEKKGHSFCRFLLGLLRVAMILNANKTCKDSLEKRIGTQLEMATLEGLLIPTYSDSDSLYDTDCVERIIHHFTSSTELNIPPFSPSSFEPETSPSSSGPSRKVAKLIDNYVAEVADDVSLKPEKFRSLAEALPECSRYLHDGLYRALDVYLKAHSWLSDQDKEQLCNIIDYRKLSIDACAHASQNERLPLRAILQALFFEQLKLRTSLAGCLQVQDTETAPVGSTTISAGRVVRENRVLKVDMERMRCRVGELEEEFGKMKHDLKSAAKPHRYISSPKVFSRAIGCTRSSDAIAEKDERIAPLTPRVSIERARSSHHSSRHRKSSQFV